MSIPIWVAFGTAVGGGALFWFIFEHGHRKKTARLANREDLPFDSLFQQYFQESGIPRETAQALWQDLAETIELPPSRLRPTDRFSEELAPEKGFEFDDPTTALAQRLKQRHKKAGVPSPDLSQIETIYDYIVAAAAVTDRK